MKLMIGIEASPFIAEIPDFLAIFTSVANPHQVHNNLFIFDYGVHAEDAATFLKEADLLQEIHYLLKLDQGMKGNDFFDYGFFTDSSVYLYKDFLSSFKICGGSDMQIEAALMQLEEHLTFTGIKENNQHVYFANSQFDELIKGIVKAYEVEIEFLDLDK
ncbi:MAG TPA: hypothetical protein DCR24_01665 [Bacillus bacterium]|nr:hypothetical protein [Bacillus sp. (in: firmicutes)]